MAAILSIAGLGLLWLAFTRTRADDRKDQPEKWSCVQPFDPPLEPVQLPGREARSGTDHADSTPGMSGIPASTPEVELTRPEVFVEAEAVMLRWSALPTRLELCFPGLATSFAQPRVVKIWGVRRSEQPHLVTRTEFGDPGLTATVTVYQHEIDLYDQLILTCGRSGSSEAQVLARISGPPRGFTEIIRNDQHRLVEIVWYEQVDAKGDLTSQRFQLQPGEEFHVPREAWALVSRVD